FAADAGAPLPKSVQLVAFGKQIGLGRIQVFWFALANDAPAEADDASARIAYRKHNSFAKTVVAPTILGFDYQARLDQHRVFVLGKNGGQPAPVGPRPAQAKACRDFAGKAALLQIAYGRL